LNFKLTDDYLTGFGLIDMEHRRFVDILKGLDQAIKEEDHLKIKKVFFAMVDYADYHFSHEEEIFEEYDFPHLSGHKKVHQEFRDKVKVILEQMKTGKDETEDLAVFLVDWLLNHIKKQDMVFRDFLELKRSNERSGNKDG